MTSHSNVNLQQRPGHEISKSVDSQSAQAAPASNPPSTTRLLQICITANLGGFLAGIHLALFSGILEMRQFAQFINGDTSTTDLSAVAKSMITTALILSFTVASPPAGSLIDRFGRRNMLLVATALFAVSSALTLGSRTMTHIVCSRLMTGVAYAIVNIVCPMYTAEMAPARHRGVLVNLYQLSITIGILYAQLCNLRFADASWTHAIWASFLPAVLLTLAVWLVVPESPTWLAATASTLPETESGTPASKASPPPKLSRMLADASIRRRLLIGAGVCSAQQWCGINAIIFFGPALISDVLQWTGKQASLRAAVYIGTANVLGTILSVGIIEQFGRRTLLLAGAPPMMMALVALGGIKLGWVSANATIGIGALVVYIVAFATTYGPLPFVVCSEIFAVRYKGVGMSFCGCMLGISSMVVCGSFLPLLEVIGGRVYFIYVACLALSSAFIWKTLPETRQLTLDQIDALLSDGANDSASSE